LTRCADHESLDGSPQRPLSNQGYALNGSAGRTQATAYVNSFVGPLNAIMRSMYAGLPVRTANVDRAFSVTDFSTSTELAGVGTVPINVAKTCTLTSMCARQDIHPTLRATA
jgi:hypothetical protein